MRANSMAATFLLALAVLGCSSYTNCTDKGRARSDIGLLEPALKMYFLHVESYPSTEAGLAALITMPDNLPDPTSWQGPYSEKGLLDPWGQPYQYACPGLHSPTSFDLWSVGPDGVDGTEDDIGNWSEE